jgi:drug/metabolite transporter (DMT)-like permease
VNPFLRALAAAALFGAATPAAKRLLAECGPVTLAGLLYLGGALATVRGAARGRILGAPPSARRRDLRRLFGSVLCGGLAGPILLLIGLSRLGAADAAVLLPLETVFTALLAMLLFHEHLGAAAGFGVAAGIAANLALAAGGGAPQAAGGACVSAACLAWAFDNHWTARIESLRPAASAFWKGACAGTASLACGLAFEDLRPGLGAAFAALGVGAAGYGLSIALYVDAARELGATRAQAIFAAAPVAGVALAALWLGEELGWRHLLAGALFAASLALIARSRHAHEHEHPEIEHAHEHAHDDGHHEHRHAGLPASHRHSHAHRHLRVSHSHPHWPDAHHRHGHRRQRGS